LLLFATTGVGIGFAIGFAIGVGTGGGILTEYLIVQKSLAKLLLVT
jgi:hypothetical protein